MTEEFSNAINCYHAGRHDEAQQLCRRILAANTRHTGAWNLSGLVEQHRGNQDAAAACFNSAIERDPSFSAAHYNLGNIHKDRGRLAEADACYKRAIALNPGFIEARNNLGTVLRDQDDLPGAIALFREAIASNPDMPELHANLGSAFTLQGRIADAADCYRRALAIKPDFAQAHHSLSALLLLSGDFEQGWREYEWRWRTSQFEPRVFRQPTWDGRQLEGQTILVHAEQGLGDTLQFVRYVPLVKQRKANIILACQTALLPLLARCAAIDDLIGERVSRLEFDFHVPLLSLPRLFETRLETIPANVPYLFADPSRVAEWREKLAHIEGFRVGINWRGGPERGPRRQRDIPLNQFISLSGVPGVRLFTLQKQADRDELATIRSRVPIVEFGDLDAAGGAFVDTAAMIMNLDLVITSDTSIAHLAGGLGTPVWVALPFAPDWRWLLDRSDSPWYPTMRLFRQKLPGDWKGVFREISAALGELVNRP
jgi:tetratricopeptide (TPR) repeat protein